MLSVSQTCKVKAHINAMKTTATAGLVSWENWFTNLSSSSRNLLRYNDEMRGVISSYNQCNDNMGLWINRADPPVSTDPGYGYINTLATIDTYATTVPAGQAPTIGAVGTTNIVAANTKTGIAIVTG